MYYYYVAIYTNTLWHIGRHFVSNQATLFTYDIINKKGHPLRFHSTSMKSIRMWSIHKEQRENIIILSILFMFGFCFLIPLEFRICLHIFKNLYEDLNFPIFPICFTFYISMIFHLPYPHDLSSILP